MFHTLVNQFRDLWPLCDSLSSHTRTLHSATKLKSTGLSIEYRPIARRDERARQNTHAHNCPTNIRGSRHSHRAYCLYATRRCCDCDQSASNTEQSRTAINKPNKKQKTNWSRGTRTHFSHRIRLAGRYCYALVFAQKHLKWEWSSNGRW